MDHESDELLSEVLYVMTERKRVRVVEDQVQTPTVIYEWCTVASPVLEVLCLLNRESTEIYHLN